MVLQGLPLHIIVQPECFFFFKPFLTLNYKRDYSRLSTPKYVRPICDSTYL